MTNESPPFITALKIGGTKEEAIFALERMWEEHNTLLFNYSKLEKENCALRSEMQKLRSHVIEECAVAAEQQDRTGYEWVRDSLWANILRRAGANVRKLKIDSTLSSQERS